MNIENNKIIYVVLAGGLSKRFGGGIKSLAKINGKTIFEKIIDLLKKQKTKILINTNNSNKIFENSKLPIVNDFNNEFQGPLAGIYSSMLWVKKKNLDSEWIFSVPSDTPFLPNNLLKAFKTKIDKRKKILIARYDGKIHPVVGAWHITLFKNLENQLKSNNRKIMDWVSKHDYDFVDFPKQNYDPFFNINKKEDIIEAEKIEKKISQFR